MLSHLRQISEERAIKGAVHTGLLNTAPWVPTGQAISVMAFYIGVSNLLLSDWEPD